VGKATPAAIFAGRARLAEVQEPIEGVRGVTLQVKHTTNSITTVSGGIVDFADTSRSSKIDLHDVAHGLAMTCRFAGQCPVWYSVAEHCILGARLLCGKGQPIQALGFLLHDAHEAFMCDIPKPLKRMLPEYDIISSELQALIMETLWPDDVIYPNATVIHDTDSIMLASEYRQLFGEDAPAFAFCDNAPRPDPSIKLLTLYPSAASAEYERMYHQLIREVPNVTA
jgi:hypothetical protein